MVKRRALRHFRDVFRWSSDERVETAEVLAAALGMAGPVLMGFLSGHAAAGFAASLGGLAVSRVEIGGNARDHVRREIAAMVPAFLAATVAVGLSASGGLNPIGRVATVLLAAVIGGFSKSMAFASTRFIIFLMIVGAVQNLSLQDGLGLLVMIVLGATWTSGLGLGFAMLTQSRSPEPQGGSPPNRPSVAQKLRHFLRSLRRLGGWNYTLRLGSCLSFAALIQWVWPQHHFHWIGLTIALLTSRRPEPGVVRTTQRTLGTGVGVILAGILLRSAMPVAALVMVIGVLAGARSHLKQRNYLAYSIVMTPLVVLVIDAGRPPELSLLADRLMATVIGGLLVTLSDLIFRPSALTRPSAEKLRG